MLSWLLIAGISALVVYALQIVLLHRGLSRTRDNDGKERPTVSVIIAARNEQENIGACLDAVCRQTYRTDRYEVIVVDDESDDGTADVVKDRMEAYPNLRLVRTTDEAPLKGKGRALSQGIDASQNDIILITDADCVVPSTWVEETARRFTPRVGLIGGITVQKADTWFGGMQSLDWAYLLGTASATVALGRSFGSIGNNLAFRKEAYQQVGGYRALPFSITEDFTLVQAIRATGNWDQVYPVDPLVLVESLPCPDWRSLFRQKLRWGRGGLAVPFLGYAIMAVGWTVHVAPLLHMVWSGSVVVGSTLLLAKAIADYTFVRRVLTRVQRLPDLNWFWAFQLWFLAYVILLPFMVLAGGRIRWKGRVY